MKLYNTKDGLRYHENWPEFGRAQIAPSERHFWEKALSESLPVANEEEVSEILQGGLRSFGFKIDPNQWIELPEGTTAEETCKWKGNKDACGNEACLDLQECQQSPKSVIIHLPKPKTMGEKEKPEPENSAHSYVNKEVKKVNEVDLKSALHEVSQKNKEIRESFVSPEQADHNLKKNYSDAVPYYKLLQEVESLIKENSELKAWRQDAEKHLIEYGKLVSYTDQLKADKQELERDKAELLKGLEGCLNNWALQNSPMYSKDYDYYRLLIHKHLNP
jgi:hypothetical protein